MKSNAPSRVADTASSIVAWPEIMTTGISDVATRHAVFAAALQRAQQVEAVVVAELDVEEDHVDRLLREHRIGLDDRAGLVHDVAFAFEHHAQRAADVLLVVDDQDGLTSRRRCYFIAHDWSSSSPSCSRARRFMFHQNTAASSTMPAPMNTGRRSTSGCVSGWITIGGERQCASHPRSSGRVGCGSSGARRCPAGASAIATRGSASRIERRRARPCTRDRRQHRRRRAPCTRR